MPLRYYGALYPTPSPCSAIEPLRQGVYWCENAASACSQDNNKADSRLPGTIPPPSTMQARAAGG
jgi:hypothetical protein